MSSLSARIAVVDDDTAVLESTQFLLEVLGHTAELFNSAEEFLERVDFACCDGLILDHHMPQSTGLQLAQQLRLEGHTLPIMLISGAMTPEIAAGARTLGIEEVQEKPVADVALHRFIAQLPLETD